MTNLFIGFFIENVNYINTIKNTFLKDININYRFFSNKDIDECIELDNYYEIFKWVSRKIDPKFFFICNEDVYININNLLKLIETLNSNELLYIGGHGDYRTLGENKFYFHSPNPGIIISNPVLKILSKPNLFAEYNNFCKKNNSNLININGVAVGYHACLFNFKLINNENIFYCNYNGNPCHKGQVNRDLMISCSNMSNKDIYNYYKIINKIGTRNMNEKQKIVMYTDGGLGNLIFQTLYALNLEIEKNCDVVFVKDIKYFRGNLNNHKIFNNLNYIDENTIIEDDYIRLNETISYYKPLELLDNNNYILYGYFQSYKYFIENLALLKEKLLLNVVSELQEAQEFYKQFTTKTCMIHIRRGDYLQYPNLHPICSDEYYIKAIDTILDIDNNVTFILFSDDINFLNNWNIIKKYKNKYIIITENNPVKILLLMMQSNYFIIANSSLSLIASILTNNNETIIAPSKWHGSNASLYKLDDILMTHVIRI